MKIIFYENLVVRHIFIDDKSQNGYFTIDEINIDI